MKTKSLLLFLTLSLSTLMSAQPTIGRSSMKFESDIFTPEALWAMGRIGSAVQSPQGHTLYNVSYYNVEQNKSRSVLYLLRHGAKEPTLLTQDSKSERGAVFFDGGRQIAFLCSESGKSQVWAMKVDGTGRRQLSDEPDDVAEFLMAPDERHIVLIKEVHTTTSIQDNDADLPKATGMVINDLMYKHWDTYVTEIPHPFLANFDGEKICGAVDMLEGEPYECPMLPFGGVEQLAFSPDGKSVAYTCRKKVGKAYAVSTDSDIFLYDIATRQTRNLCKSEAFVAAATDDVRSFENQAVNAYKADENMGYDQNPQFSPDGRYVAWLSMERDGYESDRTRLCLYELATGKKTYVTESLETGVNEFCWDTKSKNLYFTACWHATTQIYRTSLKGQVEKLTEGVHDYVLQGLAGNGKALLAKRHSMSQADEVYLVDFEGKATQLTFENKHFYDHITFGEVKERWVETVDGKKEQCWVIYPPHFDASKKYPTLLYCEGGPQSPVSQFWSYRWNFQMMAAGGYIVIAPNRRGLPGYGMEWLEEISGDYTGLCMSDYLSAIDDICREPYVDKDRLGAVGASFGGFSVYWLAGNHNKRFKAFIAHDGIYNTQQQYVETEEMWFPNWDLGSAPWVKAADGQMQKAYRESPHLYVDRWDTPILCIHGQRDFRIEYTQAESAFAAARMRGLPAQMLLFPDENHWVLKPQNGVLWQRTFRRWLDKWLKN